MENLLWLPLKSTNKFNSVLFFEKDKHYNLAILGSENCNNYEIERFNNPDPIENLDFTNYISKGVDIYRDLIEPIGIIFKEDQLTHSNVKICTDSDCKYEALSKKVYQKNQLYFKIKKEGNHQFLFSAAGEDPYPKECQLLFTIKKCDWACSKCTGSDNKNCVECNEDYYPYKENPNHCIEEKSKPDDFFLNSEKQFEKCEKQCKTCKDFAYECLQCIDNYYKIEDTNDCINEDTKPKNYYLNNNSSEYKTCFPTCGTCKTGGTKQEHNCETCGNCYKNHPKIEKNCVEKCQNYFYIAANNDYICTDQCPAQFKYLNAATKECKAQCEDTKYIFSNECLDQCPYGTTTQKDSKICTSANSCIKDHQMTKIGLDSIKNAIDDLAKKYSQEYWDDNKVVKIIQNQNNEYTMFLFKEENCVHELVYGFTLVDLNSCIDKIRNKNTISSEIPIIVLNVNINKEGGNQASYALYHGITGGKLNWSICKDEKITITKPWEDVKGVNIEEAKEFSEMDIDVYNPNDPFFTDICFPYTSENGTDVPLEDRKNTFFQNVSLCEEGCEYQGVDLQTQEVKCSCEIQEEFVTSILDNPLTGDLMELIDSANLDVFKCYKGVFNTPSFLVNIGGWVTFGFAGIQFFFTIFYCIQGWNSIKKSLIPVVVGKAPPKKKFADNKNKKSKKKKQKNYFSNEKNGDIKEDDLNNSIQINIYKKNNNKESNNNSKKNEVIQNIWEKSEGDDNNTNRKFQDKEIKNKEEKLNATPFSVNSFIDKQNSTNPNKWLGNSSNMNHQIDLCKSYKKTLPITERNQIQLERNNVLSLLNIDISIEELNKLELYDALLYDKRKFCQFYWQQLKIKQPIINTFFNLSPYESLPIKAMILIFNITVFFTLNALLYDIGAISSSFKNGGKQDFMIVISNEFTRLIFSTMIGIAISSAIDCLMGGNNKRIFSLIKKEKNEKNLMKELAQELKKMKNRNIIFLCINYLLMGVFWYYNSAFCYVYYNTSITWLVGSIVTWIIVMLIPCLTCLLAASLRFMGLKCKWESAYRLSLIFTE